MSALLEEEARAEEVRIAEEAFAQCRRRLEEVKAREREAQRLTCAVTARERFKQSLVRRFL